MDKYDIKPHGVLCEYMTRWYCVVACPSAWSINAQLESMKTVIDQENTGKIHEEVSFGVFQFKCHTGVCSLC